MTRRIAHTAPIIALALAFAVAPAALAGKGGGGGKPSGGSGSSFSLVLMDGATQATHYGRITFDVSTTATTTPQVGLRCYQGSNWVYDAYVGYFPGYMFDQWFTPQVELLGRRCPGDLRRPPLLQRLTWPSDRASDHVLPGRPVDERSATA